MSDAQQEALFPVIDGHYKLDSEPTVGIGVVLSEDERREVHIEFPEGTRLISADEGEEPAYSGTGYSGAGEAQKWSVSLVEGEDGTRYLKAQSDGVDETVKGEKLRFKAGPKAEEEKLSGELRGLKLLDVPAGRGFHWSKTIDIEYAGELVLNSETGSIVVVNELPIEAYLLGVITGEMSGECPAEYMKAQAVAARSWLLAQKKGIHAGEPYDWCNDDCCQRYQGLGGVTLQARAALGGCRAEVLITEDNNYCDARYSKSTGGISEDAENVWGEKMAGLVARVDGPDGCDAERFFPITDDNAEEYLTGDWLEYTDLWASPCKIDEEALGKYLGRVDESGSYFRWEIHLTHDEIAEAMRKRGGAPDLKTVTALKPGKRGRSGRLIELTVEYQNQDGAAKSALLDSEYNIRAGLSPKFLFSSLFIMTDEKIGEGGALNEVTLRGGGWGHGAGLCQIGGLSRALSGQKYEEILAHYFPGTNIEAIY